MEFFIINLQLKQEAIHNVSAFFNGSTPRCVGETRASEDVSGKPVETRCAASVLSKKSQPNLLGFSGFY